MKKSLLVLAAVVGVLSISGCCWPLHEGRHRSRDWGESTRPEPSGRPEHVRTASR